MLAAGAALGPYRIVAPLGAGGMGEVYRAHDARLGRDVAIKVLPQHLAATPELRARFEREARTISQLNHPHICTLFDVGHEKGTDYLVMELLGGETLAHRLEKGPLPVADVLRLGAEIASALDCAHSAGVVHRDLKPGNVMLTKSGAKLMDFGLARVGGVTGKAAGASAFTESLTVTQPLTGEGAILGTFQYMAPEQLEGKEADARADIWALGCVLYEMATGRRAFAGESQASLIASIMTGEPRPIAELQPLTPPALERIVKRCLEKDPEERFQNARDLAFNLQGAGGPGEKTAPVAPGRSRAGHRRPRLALAAAGLAVLAVVVVTSVWLRSRTAPTSVALERKRVAVAVFENQTGDGSLAPLGRMASDWITEGVSRIEGLEAVPSTSVLFVQPARGARTSPGTDPVRALAEATGAGTVVTGTYYLQRDTLRFQARITDAVHDRLLQGLDPVSGPRGAPMEAIDLVRQRVLGAIASNLEAVHGMGTEQRPPLYDAYREFIAGFEVFLTDDADALRHFRRATELDSTFLVPLFYEAYIRDAADDHARVAEILHTLGGKREELPPYARHWLDMMQAYTLHRHAEALQDIRLGMAEAPRDPMGTLWNGYLAILNNRPREALEVYGRFGPRPYPGHVLGTIWMANLCTALHLLGDHTRELKEAHAARVAYPDESELWTLEARALGALGRTAELDRLMDERLGESAAGGTPDETMLAAAGELRAHGHRAASLAMAGRAVECYRGRLESEPDSVDWLRGLVDALRQAERWDEAQAACQRLVQRYPGNPVYRGMLGCLAARLGRREEAARAADELRRAGDPYLFGAHTFRRACIAALLGEKQKAVDLLRESFAEGYRFGLGIHREEDLEPLWDYPPFQDLLRPKG